MFLAIKDIEFSTVSQKLIVELYETYADLLLAYTRKNYQVPEDHARDLVYKTIFRIADVYDRYDFASEKKRRSFVFRTYINFLRNYYRDNKSFESRNFRVEARELGSTEDESQSQLNPKIKILQQLLDEMEEWERILVLMRGQDVPYSEISKFVNKPEKHLKVYYARLKKKLLDEITTILNKK
jgi:RNA polymerase sigma factor (sigma-70 family)